MNEWGYAVQKLIEYSESLEAYVLPVLVNLIRRSGCEPPNSRKDL